MIPILFSATESSFTTNGIGRMADAISCIITEARNGIFELSMQYPVSGIHYSDLEEDRILFAQPRPGANNQAFTIYKISRPLNGIVTVSARHISYQLNKVTVMPFTAGSCSAALTGLKTNSIGTNPFTFTTDKSVTATFSVTVPSSLRSLLGGTSGSILETYGTGEFEWDMYTVKLWLHRGSNNGVTIRYGKNLTGLTNETNVENVYTGIVPYYASMDTVVVLPEGVIWGEHTTDYPNLMAVPVDLTSKFDADTVPTVEQLRSAAQSYLASNDSWQISQSIKVNFVNLADTEEYKNVAVLQRVNLCDTVTVVHPELGVSATAKVIQVKYDVLNERYTEIELGDARTDLTQAIMQAAGISEGQIPNKSEMQAAIDHATSLITGGLGGHIVINRNANGEPEELLIMDTGDTSTAVNVWRWNLGGLGHSSTGYNGPFSDVAITQDGQIVADYITAGTLSANRVRAGLLTSTLNPDTYWDLDTGTFHMSSADAQQVAQYVDASGLILSMPYTINGFNVSFKAQLLSGDTDITTTYLASAYTWWKKENFELTYLGSGYTWVFDLQDFVYGGSIILKFEAMSYQQLLTAGDDILVDANGDELLCYASPTNEPYISCETDFTNGRAVAALEMTSSSILSRLNNYDGHGHTFESGIAQSAHAIALTVRGDAGTTGAGIEISLLDENGDVIDSADGNIVLSGNVVFKSNLTDGITTISGDNLRTGVIHDINDNVVFNLVDGTLDISDGSINLGSGQFVVNSSGIATMNEGYLGTVTVNGSISGGAIYQTVSGAGSGSIGGNSPNGRQASITNGIVSAGQFTINSQNPISLVAEGMDDRGHYGIYCTGHFSTNGAIWTNGDIGSADIICRGNSYAQNFIQSSDRRLKEDIKYIGDESEEFIYNLKPASFKLKSDDKHTVHHGFIAQDVQEVSDWGVVTESDVKLIDGKPTLALNYTEIIADLVATVQKQNERIEALERIINGD